MAVPKFQENRYLYAGLGVLVLIILFVAVGAPSSQDAGPDSQALATEAADSIVGDMLKEEYRKEDVNLTRTVTYYENSSVADLVWHDTWSAEDTSVEVNVRFRHLGGLVEDYDVVVDRRVTIPVTVSEVSPDTLTQLTETYLTTEAEEIGCDTEAGNRACTYYNTEGNVSRGATLITDGAETRFIACKRTLVSPRFTWGAC